MGQVTHHSGVVNYPIVMTSRAEGFFNTDDFHYVESNKVNKYARSGKTRDGWSVTSDYV